MAQTRLLSQISSLHTTISTLKAENRRLEARSKASRAYARTVEDSTFLTTSLSSQSSLIHGLQAAPLPRLRNSSSTTSIDSNLNNTSYSSSSSSSSSSSNNLATTTTTTTTLPSNVEQLERDNFYYVSRIKELEEQLEQTPKREDVLASHEIASNSYLADREKRTIKMIADKLILTIDHLSKLKNKRKRVALKEKIMIEIETGRVGTRKDPVPSITKKIAETQVHVRFMKETHDIIKTLASQLHVTKINFLRREELLKKQIEEKKKIIMNQGLRIRNYEQDAIIRKEERSMVNHSLNTPLSVVLSHLGPTNRIETPAGSLVFEPLEAGTSGTSGTLETETGSGGDGGRQDTTLIGDGKEKKCSKCSSLFLFDSMEYFF